MVKLLIQAIRQNSRIEVCYLHGLKGMDGANLRLLTDMLTESNIWAINLGESPALSEGDWLAFAEALPKAKVGFMFAEMESSRYRAVKKEIIAKLRANRKSARYPDAALNKQVTLMWWNPSSLQRGAGVKI